MTEALSEIADRVVRVFVSSTFRHMHAGRDELVKRVFPQLRRLCDERGVSFIDVDLRWGATDEGKEVEPACGWATRLTPWPERRLASRLPRRRAGIRRLREPAPEGMKLAGRFPCSPSGGATPGPTRCSWRAGSTSATTTRSGPTMSARSNPRAALDRVRPCVVQLPHARNMK